MASYEEGGNRSPDCTLLELDCSHEDCFLFCVMSHDLYFYLLTFGCKLPHWLILRFDYVPIDFSYPI